MMKPNINTSKGISDPGTQSAVSIIIVSYNTCDILHKCLSRVEDYRGNSVSEIIVVDNASSDQSVNMVKQKFPDVILIENESNNGFAAANNQGMKIATGNYILLLNSDAYLMPESLINTLHYMDKNQETGILGVQLINEDETTQISARTLPSPWHKIFVLTGLTSRFPDSPILGAPDYSNLKVESTREVGWVSGAFFMVRKEVLDKIGFLDDRYFMYYEEVDFCLRTQRAGWQVIFLPHVKVIHLGGASSKKTKKEMSASGKQLLNYRIESEIYYYAKNHGIPYVILTSTMEVFWQSLIWLKNSLIKGKFSAIKKRESALTIKLFLKNITKYPSVSVSN